MNYKTLFKLMKKNYIIFKIYIEIKVTEIISFNNAINIKNQLKSYIYIDLEKEQVYRLYCSI